MVKFLILFLLQSDILCHLSESIMGWWDRYQGDLIGAFLAALSGVIIALFAFFLNERKQRKEKENIYKSILLGLYVELEAQKYQAEQIEKQVKEIFRVSASQGRMVASKTALNFNLKFLEDCRNKLMDIDFHNEKMLAVISSFLNLLKNTNHALSFESIIEAQPSFTSLAHFQSALNTYESSLVDDYLKRIQNGIPHKKEIIEHELRKYGGKIDLDKPIFDS